jgi:hypothetical protein
MANNRDYERSSMGVGALRCQTLDVNGADVSAELAALDGLTASADELNAVADGSVAGATITLGDAAAGAQTAAVQLLDGNGDAIAHSAVVQLLFSDAATGLDIATTGPDSVAAGTDGDVLAITAKKHYLAQSEADGDLDVAVSHAGSGEGFYLVVVLPNGRQVVSDEIIPTPAG